MFTVGGSLRQGGLVHVPDVSREKLAFKQRVGFDNLRHLRKNRAAFDRRVLHVGGENILIARAVDCDRFRVRIPKKRNHPGVSVADGTAVDRFHEDLAVRQLHGDRKRDVPALAVLDREEEPRLAAKIGLFAEGACRPVALADGGLLTVPQPQPQTLDVVVHLIAAQLVADGAFRENRAEGRVGFIPQFRVVRVGQVRHRPFRPAGIFRLSGETFLPVIQEDRAGADRRGRRAAHERLRVAAVGDDVFQRGFLIGGIFLRLVDDQQVVAFAQTALGRACAEIDDALALLDVFKAELLGGLEILARFQSGFGQTLHDLLPRAVGRGGAVSGIQHPLAVLQAPDRAHDENFGFAVAPRHRPAEFHVNPQPVLAGCHDVFQQERLPVLRGASGTVVKCDRFRPQRFGVGLPDGYGRSLSA